MPKTKLQNVAFTIIMVIVMVYAMVYYNMAIGMGGINNKIFLLALQELPVMGVIAFLLEFLFVEKLAKKITFKIINPKEVPPIFITLTISSLIVCFMCPLMSFFTTVLFNYTGMKTLVATWLQIAVRNFPMALCWQIFYAGPFVRFLFNKLLKK